MSEHKRLYTLLQLISLLGKPGGYPVKRLAGRFQVSTRTIYRYFVILRE
jgi:predicted DNA-binding transcriptional regulator YafY